VSAWLTISLVLALLGVVAYILGAMWRADRRGGKLRRAGDWGGFVTADGQRLTPSATPAADSAAAGLPKSSRMGFLSVTPDAMRFQPLPFAFLWGGRRFRLSPDQLQKVSHAVEDVRGVFLELKGYDGQMVLFCSRREGLQEAMERLVPNSPESAG
jgi:hypothetical protein